MKKYYFEICGSPCLQNCMKSNFSRQAIPENQNSIFTLDIQRGEIYTKFGAIWTTPWADENALFYPPYLKCFFFLENYAVFATGSGNTPLHVWFNLNYCLSGWKCNTFKVCYSLISHKTWSENSRFSRPAKLEFVCFSLFFFTGNTP